MGILRLLLVLGLGLTLGLSLTRLLLARLTTSLVHLVKEVQAGHLQLVRLLLDLGSSGGTLTRLALADEFPQGGNLLLDTVSLGLVELVGVLVQGLLGVIQDAVGTVGRLDSGLALLVLLGIFLRVLNHLLDLRLRQTRSGGNGDGLVLVRALVLGMNVDDGVGVNVEGDLDLRNATVGGGDANELEVAEHLVVFDELTLTLVDLDLDSSLEVGGSGEDLRLLGGDGSVAVDQTSENTAQSLNTQRQRSDIKKQEVLDLTGENGTLDSSSDSDGLIGVDGLGGITAEDALDGLGNLGHTSHTTNQNDLLDILGLQAGVLESLANGLDGLGDQRVHHGFELRPGHLQVDVLGARSISSDERQADVSLERRGQLDLGLLGSLTDSLDGHAVARQVNTGLGLEVLDNVAD